MFTGALVPKHLAKVTKPSKGSIRNLQEEIIYGEGDESEEETTEDPTIIFQEKVDEPIMLTKEKN